MFVTTVTVSIGDDVNGENERVSELYINMKKEKDIES